LFASFLASCLPRSSNYLQKIIRLQTRSSNQSAVHIGLGEELGGIGGLGAAAVEDADDLDKNSTAYFLFNHFDFSFK